ncbi:MAG: S-layer homology domain-containing protein [Kosmotogaceae bacterium]
MKKYVVLVFLALVMSAFTLAVSYSDVPEDHWAYDAVMKTTSAGLLKGFPDETFQGKEVVSRYQLAEVLSKTLDYVDTGDQKAQEIVFALTKKVAGLSLEISDSKKAVADVNNDIDGLMDRVGTLETDMDVVFDQVDSNVFNIMEIENKVSDLEKDMGGFITADDFEYMENAIDKISSDLFAIKLSKADAKTVDMLEENFANLDEKMAEIEGKTDTFVTSEQMSQKIDFLYKKIGLTENKLDEKIAGLEAELSGVKEGVVGPAFDQINKNVSDITSMKDEIGMINADIDELSGTYNTKIGSIEKSLSDLQITTKFIGQAVANLGNKFVTKEEMNAFEGKLDVVYDQIDSNIFDIIGLEDEVKNIKENYVTVEEFEAAKAEYDEMFEVTYDQIDSNVFDILDLERSIEDIKENYVSTEDFEYVENVTDKLSSDLFSIKLSKADAKDVKNLEEKVGTLESDVNEKVESVKSDNEEAVKKVDEKVEKASKTANSSLWIGLAGLAVGIAALILGLQ